ncbi:putative metabolite transport protein CsbC [compost metagenome]
MVTIVAILLIDRIGRRILLLAGSTGMFVSLGMMAVAFTQATMTTASDGTSTASLDGAWATVALIAANAFVVFFGASWGPVVWVLLGEMFPNRIRASALAVAAAAQWVANFAISTSFPVLADIGLSFAYAFYAFFALLSLFFVFYKIPETRGKELEDMRDDFVIKRGHIVESA